MEYRTNGKYIPMFNSRELMKYRGNGKYTAIFNRELMEDRANNRVNREDSRAKILDTPSWDLQQCRDLVLDGSTVTL